MKIIKISNIVIVFFISIFGITYGVEPYDEIIDDLTEFQKKLAFIYGRYVHGTPEEKSKACEEMEEVCGKIEKKLEGMLSDENGYISIDVKTIQEKIASFRRSKKNLGGCIEVFKSDQRSKVFEAYLGANEEAVTGLRGLLKILIDHLKINNDEHLIDRDTKE